jgi:hypothetical protein
MFSRRGRTGSQSYFLGNKRCFFHRYADSGFRNKWCGLWSGGRKIMEYFAVSVDGEWLCPQNQKSFEYDFSKAVHTYETAGGKVTETIFVPEEGGGVVVVVNAFPGARIEAKAAINIRLTGENVTSRRYAVSRVPGSVRAQNDIGTAFISAGPGGRFEALCTYEEHCPSGEKQNYFLPCKLSFRRTDGAFSIGAEAVDVQNAGVMLRMKESLYGRILRGKISCDNPSLQKAFESCVLSLELLRKDGGYYAGLPWFQQFWGRDTLWSLPAVISLGRHDEARSILRSLGEKSENGKVPNFIPETGEKAMNAIDATPLWVMGLERYVRCSGDVSFLREMERYLQASLEFLASRAQEGFLEHDKSESETWMDTLHRPQKAVEVQSLYYRALLSATYLFLLLGKDAGPLQRKAEWLQGTFARAFCSGGTCADRIENGKPVLWKTANVLVPMFLGPGRALPRVLSWAENASCLLSERGIRTLGKGEEGYSPGGYHTGASWSLTTAWAAAAEFSAGRPEQGWSMMKMLADDVERDGIGCIGECWNSEDGTLTGCPLQLWGAALFVTVVDDYMLGIEVDAPQKTIYVSPRMPKIVGKIERSILVGMEEVVLSFERAGQETTVSCSSPEIKLIKRLDQK